MVNNVLFLEIIEGYSFRVFQGLPLFGRLLLFVYDKIPRAMFILGATTIRQVRVVVKKVKSENFLSYYFEN